MEPSNLYRMPARDHQRGVQDVRGPVAHEGIGRALRGAYGGASDTLPADLDALLSRIS